MDKEFHNKMRMAVVAVWTIGGCDGVELSHKFLLIALQVWSEVVGNPICLRDIFHIGDALIIWCVDEFWHLTIRLIGHRFIG